MLYYVTFPLHRRMMILKEKVPMTVCYDNKRYFQASDYYINLALLFQGCC